MRLAFRNSRLNNILDTRPIIVMERNELYESAVSMVRLFTQNNVF